MVYLSRRIRGIDLQVSVRMLVVGSVVGSPRCGRGEIGERENAHMLLRFLYRGL